MVKFVKTQWFKYTKDPAILNIISGASIDVSENIEHNCVMKELHFSAIEQKAINEQIVELTAKEQSQSVFLFRASLLVIFLLSQRSVVRWGLYSTYTNLIFLWKKLNFAWKHWKPFSNWSLHFAGYLTISVWVQDWKDIRFYHRGVLMEYVCLPFGLTFSPTIFYKVMKVIVSTLQKMGFIVTFYLDDGWHKGDTYLECPWACEATYNLLLELGFLLNNKKSCLIPSQCIEVLGHMIDSVQMVVYLPKEKEQKIVSLCSSLLIDGTCSLRFLAKVPGTLVSCFRVCPLEQLHYHSPECLKVKGLTVHHGNWDAKISLNSHCITGLNWWIANLPGSTAPIRRPNPSITSLTDSSRYGWGGVGVVIN